MFREAYAIAREFTKPVVLSRLTVAGQCSSSIGAYVVINKEGWIVTAWHIIEQLERMLQQDNATREHEARVAAIQADATLPAKEKSKGLAKLGKLPPDQTRRCSAWWGPGSTLVDVEGVPLADLAVGRLEPFDPASTKIYPVFKDPSKDFQRGASLCKLGFPFHSITPTWDAAAGAFKLPPGALPLPLFPMDGIFTRVRDTVFVGEEQPPFPIQFVETSTPGLRGQSGGPTFDSKGTIWAIQSQTMHLPLGFDPPVPGGKGGEKEHQFLNVGLGVHPTTMFALFKKKGIDFQISAY